MELPPSRRNLRWLYFAQGTTAARIIGSKERSRHLLGQFRAAAAAQHPGDTRLAELIDGLCQESARFREWWDRYSVEQALTGKITVRHPALGTLRFDVIELGLRAHPSLTMTVQVPARPSDREKLLRLPEVCTIGPHPRFLSRPSAATEGRTGFAAPPGGTVGVVNEADTRDLSLPAVARRYEAVGAGFTARVDGIGVAVWDRSTPCTDWTVRDLVAHVVDTARRVGSLVGALDSAPVGSEDDLVACWGDARDAIAGALADEAAAERVVSSGFGEQPFSSLVGRLLCADTLLHTWDLARATGQDERLDPEAVAAALGFLTPIDEAIRRPGGFAPKIEPPAGADEQTRLLCFAGRAS